MTVNAYDAGGDELPEDEEILELTGGENPIKFLATSDLSLAKALIAGIDDLDRLEGWRLAEQRHIERSGNKTEIHEHLDSRERELTGSVANPTPEPTSEPVTATDGGTEIEYDESEDVDETDEPEPEQIHPDARALEAGEVLVVDRGEKIEYVFPTMSKVDSPYISRAYESDTGKLWMELEINEDDYRSRQSKDPDHESIDEIDVDAPRKAATGGEN